MNFDIIALSECWLTQASLIPYLPGYNYNYAVSVFGKSGGVVMYTKDNLIVETVDTMQYFVTSSVEILTVSIKNMDLFFSTVYRHPMPNENDFLEDFENFIGNKTFQNSNYRNLICGDFNINTLGKSNKVNHYISLIKSSNFSIYASKPTRITSSSSTCIDHIIYQLKPTDEINCTVSDLQVADHKCITIEVSYIAKKHRTRKILRRVHSEKNIQKFKNCVHTTNWTNLITDSNSLNENTLSFIKKIVHLYGESFPLVKQKNHVNDSDWINSDIRKMILHKNFLLKKSKRTKKPKDISRFKLYNSVVRAKITKQKQTYFSTIISASKGKKKWDFINKVQNKQKASSHVQISATNYKNHLDNVISRKDVNKQSMSTTYNSNTAVLTVSDVDEIFNCIMLLKNKFTYQENDIPMFLWKQIAEDISAPITYLVNTMISSAQFPNMFKSAFISPIFKRGDKNLPNNYRPIATLHNLSKVFERVIYNRILSFCSKFNILPDYQFGFRPHFSTKDAIASLVLQIENNSRANKKTCCVFLDLSKAFDMVNYDRLLQILYNLGFRGQFFNLLSSYLNGRTYKVKIGNDFSQTSNMTRGVPQGSIISPILYSLYVTDFSFVHEHVFQYADDSTIIISYNTLEDLKLSLCNIEKKLQKFITDRHLTLNTQKTEIMLIGEQTTHTLSFMNEHVTTIKAAKFLGIYISSVLNFDFHTEKLLIPSIRRHYPFFSKSKHYFNKDTKKLVFRSFINSVILYGTPFLLLLSKSMIRQLEKAYNRAIRIFFNLHFMFPSNDLHFVTGIPSLSTVIKHYSLAYTYLIFNQKVPSQVHSHFKKGMHRNNFILKSQKGRFSLHNAIAHHWNALPPQTKSIASYSHFKAGLHANHSKI